MQARGRHTIAVKVSNFGCRIEVHKSAIKPEWYAAIKSRTY